MKELQRIESRESFPTPDRPMATINLMKGTGTFYRYGKEMNEEELATMMIRSINALNSAENQIAILLKWIAQYKPDQFDSENYTMPEYLEEYPVEEDYKKKYKLEDMKEALFHAMMRKDEKKISHYINLIHLNEEKTKSQSLTANC